MSGLKFVSPAQRAVKSDKSKLRSTEHGASALSSLWIAQTAWLRWNNEASDAPNIPLAPVMAILSLPMISTTHREMPAKPPREYIEMSTLSLRIPLSNKSSLIHNPSLLKWLSSTISPPAPIILSFVEIAYRLHIPRAGHHHSPKSSRMNNVIIIDFEYIDCIHPSGHRSVEFSAL